MCYSHAKRSCYVLQSCQILCYVLQRVSSAIYSSRRLYLACIVLYCIKKSLKVARCARWRLEAGGAKPTAVTCVTCYGANTGHNTVLCVTKMLRVSITLCYVLRYGWL